MQSRAILKACSAALGLAAFPMICRAGTWTNASGDSLWSNPQNWDNGKVPAATDYADLGDNGLNSGGTIDLEAQVWTLTSLDVNEQSNPELYSIVNGTLKLTQIVGYSHYPLPSAAPDVISANLTTGGSSLLLGQVGKLTISGVIGGNGGAGRNDFSVYGAGTLTGANTYTGSTVATGLLTFAGASGSAANSSEFDIEAGTLQLDNSAAANSLRLGRAPTIVSRFGTLNLIGNDTTALSEGLGALNLTDGVNQLSVLSQGADVVGTFQGIYRSGSSTLNVTLTSATGGTPGRVTLLSPGTVGFVGGSGLPASTQMSILPYAASYGAAGVSLVTYDGGPDRLAGTADDIGLRPLSFGTEFAPSVPSGDTPANVRLTTPQAFSGSSAINSLVMSGATLALASGAHLMVTSGAVGMDNQAGAPLTAVTGGTGSSLDFGSAEAIFHVASAGTPVSPQRFTLAVPISGSGGLTKSGPGSLVLSAVNTYSGGTTVNQGELVSAMHGALPSGTITLSGIDVGLAFESQDQTVSNSIVLDTGVISPLGFETHGIGVRVAQGITATLTGSIAGTDELLVKTGAGILRLQGPVSSSVTVPDGTLYVNNVVGTRGYCEVRSGATLAGTGQMAGQIGLDASATLEPGDPVGVLSIQQIQGLDPSATIRFELDGTSTGAYSQLRFVNLIPLGLGGSQLIGGTLDLNLGYTPQIGDSFTIVDDQFAGPQYGRFSNLPEGSDFWSGNTEFQITYAGGDGNDVVVTVVPEPVTIGLMLPAGLLLVRRRRRAGS